MTAIILTAFIVWLSLSVVMLMDAIVLKNWHSACGWLTALLFVLMFFFSQVTKP